MRMLRRNCTYVLTILLLLAATACTKTVVEESSTQEIAVKALQTLPNKASTTPSSKIETMGIFANYSSLPAGTPSVDAWMESDFLKSRTPDFPEGDPSKLYLNDQCFGHPTDVPGETAFVGINPEDGSHKKHLWPSGGSLIFSAYSPYDFENKHIVRRFYRLYQEPAEMGRLVLQIVLNKNTPVGKQNLQVPIDKHENFDLLWADPWHISDRSIGKQDTPVNIRFKHAMSKLTFKISNPDLQFMITAKLINCVNLADFFSGKSKGAPGWLPGFKSTLPHSLLVDYIFYEKNKFTETNDTFVTEFLTIPMDLKGIYPIHSSTTAPVMLVLDIYNKDGVGHQQKMIELSTITPFWNPNKHYIFNIMLAADPIDFTVDLNIKVDEADQDVIKP